MHEKRQGTDGDINSWVGIGVHIPQSDVQHGKCSRDGWPKWQVDRHCPTPILPSTSQCLHLVHHRYVRTNEPRHKGKIGFETRKRKKGGPAQHQGRAFPPVRDSSWQRHSRIELGPFAIQTPLGCAHDACHQSHLDRWVHEILQQLMSTLRWLCHEQAGMQIGKHRMK